MTLEEAKNLRSGQIIESKTQKNADGTPRRFKVNGKPKTWKRTPSRVHVPLKHGLYWYGWLDETVLSNFTIQKDD